MIYNEDLSNEKLSLFPKFNQRMQRIGLMLILLGMLVTSCIPTKDLVYLQGTPQESGQIVNAVDRKPYRLQINDIITVDIKAENEELVKIFQTTDMPSGTMRTESSLYFTGFVINDRGNIRIPLLDEVNVLGMTLEEVRETIEKRMLNEYFTPEAYIFVQVKMAGFRYTTNGEVLQPGTKILFQEKVNILEAVANSGDITLTGDRKNVVLVRQLPHGTEMHTLDLTSVDIMKSPYFYLQPNDYIYVKPLPQKSWGTGTTGVQSLTTVISILSLLTTVTLLLTR